MKLILDTHPREMLIGKTGVSAEIEVYLLDNGSHRVIINGWSSRLEAKGNTNRAIRMIRKKWPGEIVANGIGLDHPDYPSYTYWLHQLQKRRIHIAYDDEGRRVRLAEEFKENDITG